MARPSPRIIGAFVAVGAAAWLAAFSVDQVAAHFLALPEGASLSAPGEILATDITPAASATPGRGPTRRPPSRDTMIRPIVERSIFDSASVGSSTTEGDTPDGPEAKSDLDATLLATVVTDPPELSSALISHKGSDKADGFGIGADLWGEGTVVGIEPRRVVIERSDGSREFIAMEIDAKVQKASARTLRPKEDDSTKGVDQLSDNKFVVDAALVDAALKNPEQLATQVRVAPHKGADGQIDGYRMSGIRRDSLFKALGIKNGDIVHAVNGQPLTSMQSAMTAYDSLQNERSFSFEITRRNQRQTFEYEIR